VPVRAFLFDFDGLIIDTETASRAGWEWLYREHGFELPQEQWATVIGTIGAPWEPMRHLEELVGAPLDADELNQRRRSHELSLLETEEFRPGILDYLDEAAERGLKTAIVSSSSNRWIDMHLERLEHAHHWDAIVAANHDVARAKPRPDLYLEACRLIGVAPKEAVAFEDSPNGVRAARAAGIFVVAVPNDVTRSLGLEEADLVLDSLADLPPAELLSRFE
jgi:putative hydrolase of the HAD superfamily